MILITKSTHGLLSISCEFLTDITISTEKSNLKSIKKMLGNSYLHISLTEHFQKKMIAHIIC